MAENPTPEIERQVRAALAVPEPEPRFVYSLRSQLAAQAATTRRKPGLFLRLVVPVAAGLLALVLIAVIVAGPRNVLAGVQRLRGYFPGIGLVDQSAPLRVLVEPITLERKGITLVVEQAVADADHTVVVFSIEGLSIADANSQGKEAPGCGFTSELRPASGPALPMSGGEARGWGSGFRNRLVFGALPPEAQEVTLFLPCITGMPAGTAPENWEIPLTLQAAPPGTEVVAIIELPTVAVDPAQPTAPAPHGLQLTLDRIVPLEDGYILYGSLRRVSDELQGGFSPGVFSLTDANGQTVPVDYADPEQTSSADGTVIPWALKTLGVNFPGPATVSLENVTGAFTSDVSFVFDAGPNPQVGQEWQLGQQVEVMGQQFTVVSARMIDNGTNSGYEFIMQTEANGLSVGLTDLEHAQAGGGGGGGGGGGNDTVSTFSSSIIYAGPPPTGPITISVGSVSMILSGSWQVSFSPPVVGTGAPSAALPEACLTLTAWQAAQANPPALPAELSGKVIGYGRLVEDGLSPSPGNYGVFVVNLDGTGRQVLGQGVWPAISPDGARAVYSGSDGLHVVELATGEDRLVPGTLDSDYSALWSPDGTQIAFVRVADLNLYVMQADGSGLRQMTQGVEYEQLVAWSPDGASLYYGLPGEAGFTLQAVSLATGDVSASGLVAGGKGLSASLSPDGQWVAFMDSVPGRLVSGLYVSRLDGTEQRLVAQLDSWLVTHPHWSADGRWLLVTLADTGLSSPVSTPALINVETCQAVPVPGIEGDVFGWAP